MKSIVRALKGHHQTTWAHDPLHTTSYAVSHLINQAMEEHIRQLRYRMYTPLDWPEECSL